MKRKKPIRPIQLIVLEVKITSQNNKKGRDSYDGQAYGFCYDDVNGQASYLEVGDPKGLIFRVGW
ncbi:MAG: beta-1,3-glucanase family protein [Anaerocolumna sp.]